MRDEVILTIAYGGDARDNRRMKALLRAWNARAKTSYSLEHNFITFAAGDPEHERFRKDVGARLPASCPLESRIRRHYAAEDLRRLKVREFSIIGSGVDGSSALGSFYEKTTCSTCGSIRRRKIRPLTLDLAKARGKDFLRTYGDMEDVVSARAKSFLEKHAPRCCLFEPIAPSIARRGPRYFHLEVVPVAPLAIPPTRVARARPCRACGRSKETLIRGEWILRKCPAAPLFRSDLEFGPAWCAGPSYFMRDDLHEKLSASKLLGWHWRPAWLLSDLTREDVRRLVPRVDVLEINVPHKRIPRRVWLDPAD